MRHFITTARGRIAALAALVISAGLPVVALGAAPAGATVSVSDEAGIRQAFDAETDTTIELTADILLDDCLTASGGELVWTSGTDLTIDGNGHTLSVAAGCDVPVHNSQRVIRYFPNSTANKLLTVRELTITGGHPDTGGVMAGRGGGIYAENPNSGNASVLIEQGSVIGSLSGNGNVGSNGGGGLHVNDGNITIDHSTIANNETSGHGGGLSALGSTQTITINSSLITGNEAGQSGGGIAGTNLVITNSTITQNQSGTSSSREGGGVWSLSGTVNVRFSTIVDNTTTFSGGAGNVELTTPVSVRFFGTVVAFPHSPAASTPNCEGMTGPPTFLTFYNFSDADTCGFGAGAGDQQAGGDPLLNALASNFGSTKTMLPTAASPLREQVPSADCTTELTVDEDQRGAPRPTGGLCEIGAVERRAPNPPALTSAVPGNGQTTLNFAASGIGDSAVSGFLGTCTAPGQADRTGTAASTPIVVNGMANGVQYACTVHANNSDGSSLESALQNVTPRTTPGAPVITSVTPGNGQMSVAFTLPDNGGAAPTGFTVTESPGGASVPGATSPIVVPGLANGTAHTFKVKATNVAGSGPDSASSASVTSSFQPDVQARKGATGVFTDVDSYAAATTLAKTVQKKKSVVYQVLVQGDNTVLDTAALTSTIAGNAKLAVTIRKGAALLTPANSTFALTPNGTTLFTVTVKAKPGTPKRAVRTVTLTVRSLATGTQDQVKIKTTRV